jgi:hypothetical protein
MSAVTDEEVRIVSDLIVRLREFDGRQRPITASTIALSLPALGQRPRIQLVLEEMEARGLLEREGQEWDRHVGEPGYKPTNQPTEGSST